MSESIGQRLRRERELRYLTLEKASADTRIRSVFLQALEADDFSAMPSAAQGRGFLRNYAGYLDLDIDEMIAEIQKNPPAIEDLSGPLPQVNLVETELPPLTESEDKSAHFWTGWFGRPAESESTHEAESNEMPPEINETKVEVESEAFEVDPLEVGEEPRPGIWSRFVEFFQFGAKAESETAFDFEGQSDAAFEADAQPQNSPKPAELIFAEIGVQLLQRRELISLTVEEVERHTHLRAVFVKALEEGAFDKLPSPVQTRGMLANYSTFLDLDTDTILLRFADVLQARHREKFAATPREKIQTEVKTSMPLLRAFIAGDLIFGMAMIVILVALAIWGVGRVVSLQDQRAQKALATPPPIVDVLGADSKMTPTFEVTLAAASEAAPFVTAEDNAAITSAPGAGAKVTVMVFAVERTFVRISVDGKVAFEGRMAPHETKVFEANNQVVVLTGNAAALRITYNGRDLGLMGGVGEVISRVYLESGVATPTATVPPTPTNTPLLTPTSTPTNTPTHTPTVTPPDGG